MRKIPPGPLTGKQPDGEQIIATIKKNEREEIVVKAVIFNGYPTVHVRLYFRDKEGKLKPTREGVTLKPGEQLQTLVKGLRMLNDAHEQGTPVTAFVMPLEPAQPPEVSEAYEAYEASPAFAPPPITSQSPTNGSAREPVSDTAKMMMKNNPGKTLEALNADRVARGKPEMW